MGRGGFSKGTMNVSHVWSSVRGKAREWEMRVLCGRRLGGSASCLEG